MVEIFGLQVPSKVINLVLVIFISYIIYRIAKLVLDNIFNARMKKTKVNVRKQKTLHSLSKNILKYAFYIIVLLSVLGILGVNTAAIVASIGAIGFVIGLAFQDILKDILAGVFILVENQYGVGDIVEIEGFKGEVIALGLKTTKVKNEQGQIEIISNRNIGKVINYSLNDIKTIIDINVAYDSDLDKVEKLLKDLVKDLSKSLNIKGEFNLVGLQSISDPIIYRITVLTTVQKSQEVTQEALKKIKEVLDKNDIKRK